MGGELIRTEELAQILHEADVRIFDCTTRLDYQPPGSDIPYIPVPGLDTFVDAHIPGADFLDIQRDFSNQNHQVVLHDGGNSGVGRRIPTTWGLQRQSGRPV
jgi:3-mercaptopyruvate sulfurtransferase SseA